MTYHVAVLVGFHIRTACPLEVCGKVQLSTGRLHQLGPRCPHHGLGFVVDVVVRAERCNT